MDSDQNRTIGLGALLLLLVVAKLTGGLDWLRAIFTFVPYQWQLNPLAEFSVSLPGGVTLGNSSSAKTSTSSSSGSSSPSSSSGTDSGSHSAMDASGNVYTINSTYGNMTDAQKADANRYAVNVGNVSG